MGDDSRIEFLSARAISGNITQAERDELLALIAHSLWSLRDLDQRIEAVHCRLCESCELRKLVGRRRGALSDILQAIRGNRLPWIIVGILLLIVAGLLGIDVTPLFGR